MPAPTTTRREAKRELRRMLEALTRDQAGFFKVGRFACRKKLADGTTVAFSITEQGHFTRRR